MPLWGERAVFICIHVHGVGPFSHDLHPSFPHNTPDCSQLLPFLLSLKLRLILDAQEFGIQRISCASQAWVEARKLSLDIDTKLLYTASDLQTLVLGLRN